MTAGIVSRSASRRGRPRPARGGAGQGDRLVELHEQIVAGTAALVSSQGWEEMLQIVARMPQYSGGGVGIFESRECCPDGVFDEPRDVDDHRRSGRARHMRSAI